MLAWRSLYQLCYFLGPTYLTFLKFPWDKWGHLQADLKQGTSLSPPSIQSTVLSHACLSPNHSWCLEWFLLPQPDKGDRLCLWPVAVLCPAQPTWSLLLTLSLRKKSWVLGPWSEYLVWVQTFNGFQSLYAKALVSRWWRYWEGVKRRQSLVGSLGMGYRDLVFFLSLIASSITCIRLWHSSLPCHRLKRTGPSDQKVSDTMWQNESWGCLSQVLCHRDRKLPGQW